MDHHHHHHHHLYHPHHGHPNAHIQNSMQFFNTSRAISFVTEPTVNSPSISHNNSSPSSQLKASMIDPYTMRRYSENECEQDCSSNPGPSRSPGKSSTSSSQFYRNKKLPPVDKNTKEYREKRTRNNEAVKKSRLKKKEESEKVHKEVANLERENERLKLHLLEQKTSYKTLKDLLEVAVGKKLSPGSEQKLFQRHE